MLHCKEKGNSTTELQEGLKNNTLDHILSFNVWQGRQCAQK